MMHITKNEGTVDRFVRIILSEVLFIVAYFWFGGALQGVLFAVALALLLTAFFGFCGMYKLFGVTTCKAGDDSASVLMKVSFGVLFVVILVAGSYYSDFFTRKFFLDDYSRMNNFYKQALFYTGQEKRRESVENYDKLVLEYAVFEKKYTTYHPFVLRSDRAFNADIASVSGIIAELKEPVYSGDLKQAHLRFEAVRPVFQDILKRNNFSMLAVALVDFHDAMEKIIDAAHAKDSATIIAVYPEVDTKLKAIEGVANDAEIQMIRQKLDEVLALAEGGQVEQLSAKAAEMKSAFVKVYLKRG